LHAIEETDAPATYLSGKEFLYPQSMRMRVLQSRSGRFAEENFLPGNSIVCLYIQPPTHPSSYLYCAVN
jgi:hypothetical protein